jgi:hypothetical protein
MKTLQQLQRFLSIGCGKQIKKVAPASQYRHEIAQHDRVAIDHQ